MIPDSLRAFAERNAHDGAPGRVWIEQRGEMCLKPGGAWKPFTAEQWMDESAVAFAWHARVKMAPLLTAVVDDAYEDGVGRLDAKLWGKLRIAHEEGPSIDRGELQRYLAELPWNPGAILHNPSIRYEESSRGVRVWTGERECWVDLELDAACDVVRTFTTTRERGEHGPTPWEGRFEDYVELGGMRVPRRGSVAWILPEGRHEYWRGEILSLRID